MKPLDFPLFADENLIPDVVRGLRHRGLDVRTVWDDALVGRPDRDILEVATRQGRVVLTHDLAFGRSAIRAGVPLVRRVPPGRPAAGWSTRGRSRGGSR